MNFTFNLLNVLIFFNCTCYFSKKLPFKKCRWQMRQKLFVHSPDFFFVQKAISKLFIFRFHTEIDPHLSISKHDYFNEKKSLNRFINFTTNKVLKLFKSALRKQFSPKRPLDVAKQVICSTKAKFGKEKKTRKDLRANRK